MKIHGGVKIAALYLQRDYIISILPFLKLRLHHFKNMYCTT